MNVLVVDDDFAIRESLDRALRANGYDVELASDGTQALGAIGAAPSTPSSWTCSCRDVKASTSAARSGQPGTVSRS
jgi:CheY-like chemotaxis protein